MEGVKNPVCIVLCLCSVLLACNTRENPKPAARRENKDPIALLRALPDAKGYERARILEQLYLTKEAIYAWNEVVRSDPERAKEAREHLERLQRLPDPVRQWSTEEVDRAWERRDETTLTRIAHAFPADAARYFERCDLSDREGARSFAKALAAAGEHYPQAVVDAMDRTKERAALDQGLAAFHEGDFSRAAALLERAGNPLSLAARYFIATRAGLPPLQSAIPHLKPQYREFSTRVHILRAVLLEVDNRYLEAHADYRQALLLAHGEPTSTAAALSRESWNFAWIGDTEGAFRNAHRALGLLSHVPDTDTRNQAYGGAANAALQLGYPEIALLYQNVTVENMQRGIIAATADRAADATKAKRVADAKVELSIALRLRAEIHVRLGQDADAQGDLQQAAELAEAANRNADRDLLRMRRLDVQGQALLKSDPVKAAAVLSEAIELAENQDSTYRAILHFKRGEARRSAGDSRADDDVAAAMKILRGEVQSALEKDPQVASEPLWTPYFGRFSDQYDRLIESRLTAGDAEEALVLAERARAFEPMQILLQSRFIETRDDLRQARANLPQDTVILQYLVLPERTYTLVITRERIQSVQQSAKRADVERWVRDVYDAVAAEQEVPERASRAAYAALFREPLKRAGARKTRIVIVPDESMQGLPFNALGSTEEGYLIERASITTAGSTSMYLSALARDRQLSADRHPTALLVANPTFGGLRPIPNAKKEVEELSRDVYPDAETLIDGDATVRKFLAGARNATIIHFAGHAVASAQAPWQSRLLLAPHGQESGELTAQKLMRELPKLERTRLVVLGACSTASGGPIGPQGLAPLVRPLIAANVPAVVGTLWDVNDASTKELLVLLHCHYRHGDDVAVALRNAQLERLRKHDGLRAWAAFQVAGYAASPYPRSAALEDSSSEHLCTQNSLHGPDGLHSQ